MIRTMVRYSLLQHLVQPHRYVHYMDLLRMFHDSTCKYETSQDTLCGLILDGSTL